MSEFVIEVTRQGHVESCHRVSAAVVDEHGTLVASAGNPEQVTFWRSAAKPFQALPLVQDGGADQFGFGPRELALTCASHSSEPEHRTLCEQMLNRIGCAETALACGPHPPLSQPVAEQVIREGLSLTPLWSNCSGKHTGMLAQARHHGWPLEGYQRQGHPLQQRLLEEVSRWTGVKQESILQVGDGCTAVNFGMPLSAMAEGYARLAVSPDASALRIREAMLGHPFLVAGTGRLCTDLMTEAKGTVLAKVGAEGVYSAAYLPLRLGITLKVEDGAWRAAPPALMAILEQVVETLSPGTKRPWGELPHHAAPILKDTGGNEVGHVRATGQLRFK